MGLVDHQVSPVKLLKNSPLDDEHFIGSDAHVPLSWQQSVTDESRLQTERKIKDLRSERKKNGIFCRSIVQEQIPDMWRVTHSLIPVSYQAHSTERGNPALKLIHPVIQCGLRNQNHVRPGDVSVVFHVAQERNGLKRLSETLRTKQEKREIFMHESSMTKCTDNFKGVEEEEVVPFRRPGCRWFRSRTTKSASSVHEPDNLWVCPFSRLHENHIML